MDSRSISPGSHIRILAFAILIPIRMANAQEDLPRREARLEVAAGAGSSRHTGALSFVYQFAVAWNRRARVGYGARYSFFGGSDLRFRTADRGQLDGNPTDHAIVRDPAIHAVNLAAHVSLRLFGGAELGFNIDVIGVSFGRDKTLESEAPGDAPRPGSPTSFNLLRGGARDRGTLNSEFYLGWQATQRLILRVGLSHFVAEYEAKSPLSGGSTRLRVDGNLAFLSAGYRFE